MLPDSGKDINPKERGRVNYEMVFRYLEKEKSIPKVG
jgi:hypothetical protein